MPYATAGLTSVQLLADRGAAVVDEESFFRSRVHFDAEGVTHSLVIGGSAGRCAVALVVRPVPGTDRLDAVSPYGYPGGSLVGEPPAVSDVDLASTGLVSVFVRERIGAPTLAGGTLRSRVFLHDPQRPRHRSRSLRRTLRDSRAAGYTVDLVPGTDVDDAVLAGFAGAYAQTMQRVGAGERYYFGIDYLAACLHRPGSWLGVVRGPDGRVAAGEIAVVSDGMLHSYLAGTAAAHREVSAGKLATDLLVNLADELGLPYNHGGGLCPGDGLEESKMSFSNSELPFVTHDLVGDPCLYDALSRGHATDRATSYFPRYRAP